MCTQMGWEGWSWKSTCWTCSRFCSYFYLVQTWLSWLSKYFRLVLLAVLSSWLMSVSTHAQLMAIVWCILNACVDLCVWYIGNQQVASGQDRYLEKGDTAIEWHAGSSEEHGWCVGYSLRNLSQGPTWKLKQKERKGQLRHPGLDWWCRIIEIRRKA